MSMILHHFSDTPIVVQMQQKISSDYAKAVPGNTSTTIAQFIELSRMDGYKLVMSWMVAEETHWQFWMILALFKMKVFLWILVSLMVELLDMPMMDLIPIVLNSLSHWVLVPG
jgi:hypothetical protein